MSHDEHIIIIIIILLLLLIIILIFILIIIMCLLAIGILSFAGCLFKPFTIFKLDCFFFSLNYQRPLHIPYASPVSGMFPDYFLQCDSKSHVWFPSY